MGFDTTELLRDAGYSEGDLVPTHMIGEGSATNFSTTSTSFASSANFYRLQLVYDDQYPTEVTTKYLGVVTVVPGSGESVDFRITNNTDSETVVEINNITSTAIKRIEPTEFEPTTTSSPVRYKAELRTNPGTNSSSMGAINAGIAIQL